MSSNINGMNPEDISIMLPKDVSNLQLPDPNLRTYYDNLYNRTIWIDYDIDQSILDVAKLIIEFNRDDAGIPVEERKPIKLLIFSYGGEVSPCFGLIDVIRNSKTKVITVNMGIAMSAALLLLIAGHERYCAPHSTALIHSGSGGTQGAFETAEAQMKDYKHVVEEMRQYIMQQTKIDKVLMNKKKSTEWYIYAEDQVNYGICDHIIDDLSALT